MKFIYLLTAAVFLFACSSPKAPVKKVVVMSSGKLAVAGDVVTLEPGTQHNETPVTVTGTKLTVKNGESSKDYEVPEAGTWLLNLKKDTLIGSFQNYGGEATREGSISQEAMMERMDSLKALMQGTNVTPAKKNHFAAPDQLIKINGEDNTIIVGPYKGIPASLTPGADGKVPEVYKFITNKDARETLDKLEKLLKQ
ncbi:MAG: hypothetical protein QM664_01725 [Flavihumibacter sp.]